MSNIQKSCMAALALVSMMSAMPKTLAQAPAQLVEPIKQERQTIDA